MKTTASRASAVSQTRGFGDLLYDKAGSRPSLDLDFAGTSSLRDKITGENLVDHTRTSEATFINSEGLVESSYSNLTRGSESLSSSAVYDIHDGGTSVVVDNTDGVYTPRGVLSKIIKPNQSGTQPSNNTGPQAPRITWNNGLGQAGYTITKSIYAKMQTGGPRYLVHYGWAGANVSTVNVKFDLQEGVIHGNQTYYPDTQASRDKTSWGINDEGGGWYRCWVTIVGTSAHPSMNWVMNQSGATSTENDFYYDSNSWDTNKGIYIAHPQLTIGPELKDYIPTSNGSSNSSPRFTHERVETGNQLASSTHLDLLASNQSSLRYSSLALSGGGNLGSKLEPYAAISPDGKYNAAKLTFVSAFTNGDGNLQFTINNPNVTKKHVFSFYAKTISGTATIKIKMGNNGTTAGGGDFTVTDQWQRFERSGAASTTGYTYFGINNNLGSQIGTSILIWGFQLEEEQDSATTFAPSIDTFTSRASNATYVDSAGLVKTSYKNLKTYSQDISNFGSIGHLTIQSDVEIAPDGTQTADKLVETATNFYHRIDYGTSNDAVNVSWYAKAAERDYIFAYKLVNGAVDQTALFDVRNGLVVSTQGVTNASIEDVGNGWFRCSFDRPSGGGTGGRIAINSTGNDAGRIYVGDTSKGLFLWGYQETLGSGVKDYSKTGATASGGPRYSHDPETLTPTGLYLEPESTNYWRHSNLFDFSGYGLVNGMYMYNLDTTTNAAIAPDGTLTATSVIPKGNLSGNNNYWMQRPHGAVQANSTSSCFIKYNGWRYVALRNGHGGSDPTAVFDLLNGTVVGTANGTNIEANIESYPNGWYRISSSRRDAGGGWTSIVFRQTDALVIGNPQTSTPNDGVSGVYIWGIQHEVSPYPTSVIITSGSNVTRAADVYTSTANLTETFEPRGLLIEEARTNVARRNNNFNQWTVGGGTMTADVTTAPDGTQTADKYVPNSGSSSTRYVYQTNSQSGTITCSLFVKSAGLSHVSLISENGSTSSRGVSFNLTNGTIQASQNANGEIIKFPNGWYRIIVKPTSGSQNYFLIQPHSGGTPDQNSFFRTNQNANGTDGMYLWGAQCEAGSFATSFIYNSTSSSVTRAADIVSISGDNFGTYRTNLTTYSNLQTGNTINGTGGFYYLDYIPYYGLSPSAKYDSTKIIPNGTNNSITRLGIQGYAPPGTNRKTISFYAKAAGFNFIHVRHTEHGTCFNLSNGTMSAGFKDGTQTLGTPESASMEDVGNGWYRCSVTNNVATNYAFIHVSESATSTDVTGNGVDGVEIYGIQLEYDYLTNYIPSTETFTSRLGNATYVDSNGLIKTAYKNNVTHSENISSNGGWTITSSGTIPNTTINSPNNTLTASEYVASSASNTDHIVYKSFSNGIKGALSIYAKSNGLTHLSLVSQDTSSSQAFGVFDLTNGTVSSTNQATAKIVDVGNGWYRCIVYPQITTSQFLIIHPHYGGTPNTNFYGRVTYAGNGSDGIYLWGAQFTDNVNDEGDYVKTEATATGAPRYSHDPETLVPTGLYLEPASTNLIKGVPSTGNAFVSNGWFGVSNVNGGGFGREDNQITPSGNLETITKFFASGGAWGHGVLIGYGTSTSSTNVSASFFMKKGAISTRYVQIYISGISGSFSWDWETKTFNSITSSALASYKHYKVIPLANDWYKFEFSGIRTGSTPYDTGINLIFRKDGLTSGGNAFQPAGEHNFLWGVQLEETAYPTSTIHLTDGATTTRPADTYTSTATTVLDRDGGNKESLWNNTAFTFGGSWRDIHRTQANNVVFRVTDATNTNSAQIRTTGTNTNNYRIYIKPSSGETDSNDQTALVGKLHRLFISNDSNKAIGYGNGSQLFEDTSTSLFDDITAAHICSQHYNGSIQSATIERLSFWKTRLPNQSLINITNS